MYRITFLIGYLLDFMSELIDNLTYALISNSKVEFSSRRIAEKNPMETLLLWIKIKLGLRIEMLREIDVTHTFHSHTLC